MEQWPQLSGKTSPQCTLKTHVLGVSAGGIVLTYTVGVNWFYGVRTCNEIGHGKCVGLQLAGDHLLGPTAGFKYCTLFTHIRRAHLPYQGWVLGVGRKAVFLPGVRSPAANLS